MKISLQRSHALTVGDGAFSHKTHYVLKFEYILNFEGNPNHLTGLSWVILLNGWILPIDVVASERVCACSLRSRLV